MQYSEGAYYGILLFIIDEEIANLDVFGAPGSSPGQPAYIFQFDR